MENSEREGGGGSYGSLASANRPAGMSGRRVAVAMAASALAMAALTLLVGSVEREGGNALSEHSAKGAQAAVGGKMAALGRLAAKAHAVVGGTTALNEAKGGFIPVEDRTAFPEDVLSAINASMDPCEDFYEYSSRIRTHPLISAARSPPTHAANFLHHITLRFR